MRKFEHLPGLMLLLQAVACNGRCPIKLEPSTVLVRYGDPVSVNCTVSEEDHNGIGWEASEGSVDLVQDVENVIWKLDNLTDWNIEPRCFGNFPAETGPPSQCVEKLNITVYKPPDSVSISVANTEDPLVERNQYWLVCEVKNIAPVQHLSVRWYKGDSELENITLFNDASKTPVNVSPTLLITPTSADDGKQYSCVAELDLGPEGPQPPPSITSEPLNITVHYKPFVECPKHVLLREGESLDTLLSCSAKGNPTPGVTWYRGRTEVSSSTPLTRRDGGQYFFIAKNIYGTVGHVLKIQVLCKPLISACPKHKKLLEGESLDTLDFCTAEGNPSPEVIWYRDQSRFKSSTPLTRRDSAQYTLIANNSLGTANHTLEIEVLYKPLITNCTDYEKLMEGETLASSVSCTAEGNPSPVVTWYRDKSEFNPSTPLTWRDGGKYTLIANNTYGTANHTLEVSVQYKPFIIGCRDHMELREGESLDTLVPCRVEGNPSPVVTWYRDQSQFNSSTPLTRRDSEQYTLIANNILGTANHTLEIEVLYKPLITNCTDNEKLMEGETLASLVSCTAEGNPSPVVTWYRDQSEFNPSTPLTRRDDGQYTLIANNTYGTANHTLVVSVQYKPFIIGCQDHIEPHEGVSLNTLVPCRVEGNPSPVITWYRNQSEVDSSRLLTRNDGGQYIFVAKNNHGIANHTLEMNILYKPLITNCTDNEKLMEGETLASLVSCTAEGNPSPVVTWYRDKSEFNPSTPLTRRDGGQYTLIANNTYGTVIHTLVISVQYKPFIIGCQDHIEPHEGVSLNTLVPCRVEGNPSPVITWYRNQSEVDSSRLLTRNNGGQYIFVAKNNHGIANHTLEMNILCKSPGNGPDPPTFERERVWVNVTEGEEAILECLAEGNPTPSLSWRPATVQNLNLSTRGRHIIASITNITLADAGDYICNATNDLGTALKTVTVTVTAKRTRKRESIYILLIFIGIIFALVLLICCCRSRMRRRRLYHVTRVRSSSRRERAEIPLMTLNSNGTTSEPAIGQLNSGQSH
ncbi:hypothetical protein GJAV_G00220300 [Gymnothorax javanicus]|nr:hypothetical protein GJAV_G00220300 [Gymnothorax javanicus]